MENENLGYFAQRLLASAFNGRPDPIRHPGNRWLKFSNPGSLKALNQSEPLGGKKEKVETKQCGHLLAHPRKKGVEEREAKEGKRD